MNWEKFTSIFLITVKQPFKNIFIDSIKQKINANAQKVDFNNKKLQNITTRTVGMRHDVKKKIEENFLKTCSSLYFQNITHK